MSNQYSPGDYDDHLCLKLSLGTWVIIGFLLRPYIIMVLSFAAKKDRMGLINMFYSDRSVMALGAVAALPAMVVIYAWFRRSPGASERDRWLWRHSRAFLIVSAIANIAIVFAPKLVNKFAPITTLGIAQLLLAGAVLFVLVTSDRIRDTFLDYPEEEQETDG